QRQVGTDPSLVNGLDDRGRQDQTRRVWDCPTYRKGPRRSGHPGHEREMPALPLAEHPRAGPLRLDLLQGAVHLQRLLGTLRLLQGALMTEQTTPTRRRASFHRLTVSNVRRLTKDSIEVSFAIPAELSE